MANITKPRIWVPTEIHLNDMDNSTKRSLIDAKKHIRSVSLG